MPTEILEPEAAAWALAFLLKDAVWEPNPTCQGSVATLMAEVPYLCDALGERLSKPAAPGTWAWHSQSRRIPEAGIMNPQQEALILSFDLKPGEPHHRARVVKGPHADHFGPRGRFPLAGVIVQAGHRVDWDDPPKPPKKVAAITLVLNIEATELTAGRLVAVQLGARSVTLRLFGLDNSAYCLLSALQADQFPHSFWSPAPGHPVSLKGLRQRRMDLRWFLAHRTLSATAA